MVRVIWVPFVVLTIVKSLLATPSRRIRCVTDATLSM